MTRNTARGITILAVKGSNAGLDSDGWAMAAVFAGDNDEVNGNNCVDLENIVVASSLTDVGIVLEPRDEGFAALPSLVDNEKGAD